MIHKHVQELFENHECVIIAAVAQPFSNTKGASTKMPIQLKIVQPTTFQTMNVIAPFDVRRIASFYRTVAAKQIQDLIPSRSVRGVVVNEAERDIVAFLAENIISFLQRPPNPAKPANQLRIVDIFATDRVGDRVKITIFGENMIDHVRNVYGSRSRPILFTDMAVNDYFSSQWNFFAIASTKCIVSPQWDFLSTAIQYISLFMVRSFFFVFFLNGLNSFMC